MDKHDMGWKPSLSIIGGVGWLIFVILWFAFYAGDIAREYGWERNFSILLMSILAVFLLIGGMWAIWSLRMIPKKGWEVIKISGFRWRILTSIIIPIAAMIFLIVWFWNAKDYDIFQNIAIILVVLLAMGGILGAIWARWGMTHGKDMKKFEDFGEDFGKKIDDAVEGKNEK